MEYDDDNPINSIISILSLYVCVYIYIIIIIIWLIWIISNILDSIVPYHKQQQLWFIVVGRPR